MECENKAASRKASSHSARWNTGPGAPEEKGCQVWHKAAGSQCPGDALKVTKTWPNKKLSDCLLNSGWVTVLYLGVRSGPPPRLPRTQEEVVLIELCLHSVSDSEDNTVGGRRGQLNGQQRAQAGRGR